ncbi:VCBS repeat-containing protein [Streptomyces sp. NBC_00433]
MSEFKPVRPKGRRRLVAACTAGILSLGAFALSTGAQAAEPGAHHVAERPTAGADHVPHISAPTTSVKKSKLAANAAAQAPAPVRYDIDGDGYGDQLYRGVDYNWYNSLAKKNVKIGPSAEQYVDVITPGNIDGGAGPDVLGLTASGKLVMFSGSDFPKYSSWGSSGWTIYNKVFAVDDVTGDGIPDIAARTFDGHLYLFPGNGNGGAPFSTRLLIGGGWGGYNQLAGAGDLDGDGISDLVARDTAGNLYLYKATGNASAPYKGKVLIGGGWNTYNQIIGLGNGESGTGYVTGRSFNGDLYQYAATGTGGLKPRFLWSKGAGEVDVMAGMGGIQNWGKKWLLGLDASGSLYGYVPTNTGTFYSRDSASKPQDFAGISNFALGVSPTDDGNAELLYSRSGALYNASRKGVRITTGWSYNLMAAPGDLSGDGKSDLLARNSSGQLYLFKGTGTGTGYTSRTLVSSGWNGYNAIIGAGDMSGDGRTDILARSTNGTLYLFKGTGNASAPFAGRIKLSSGFGAYNKIATAGDIDGNGLADLLAVKASTGTLYRFSAYGTGQFAAAVSLGNGWNTYSKLF